MTSGSFIKDASSRAIWVRIAKKPRTLLGHTAFSFSAASSEEGFGTLVFRDVFDIAAHQTDVFEFAIGKAI